MHKERTLALVASTCAVFLAVLPGILAWLAGRQSRYDANLAVLTATLIALVWYTCFTYEAVKQDHIFNREYKLQTQIALNERAQSLLDELQRFPSKPGVPKGAAMLKSSPLWREERLLELERLASAIGDETADQATKAAGALRWLSNRIQLHRDTHEHPDGIPWDSFNEHFQDASAALNNIVASGKRVVG